MAQAKRAAFDDRAGKAAERGNGCDLTGQIELALR